MIKPFNYDDIKPISTQAVPDLKDIYYKYLQSESWAKKRSARLKLDDFTCQLCGSKTNLQVHHITYENVYHEDVGSDLITLCKSCHELIEKMKRESQDKGQYLLHKIEALELIEFCESFENLDYSNGGNVNFCDLAVIKEYMGKCPNTILLRPMAIREYFINKRREQISAWLKKGYSPSNILKHSKFSKKMVDTTLQMIKQGELT